MARPPALPVVLAMVVCDAVWRDPATGKHFLLGCFSAIGAHAFPTVHPALAVYIALTEGYGRTPLLVRLVDPEGAPVHESRIEAEFTDPRAILEIGLQVQNLAFQVAGEHRLQLHAGDDLVMERRIAVTDLRQRPG